MDVFQITISSFDDYQEDEWIGEDHKIPLKF
jgi:hypothetical protein